MVSMQDFTIPAPSRRTVSLVLGGGGARGLAHIGVIRWLEENNYQIQSISGCSMGALVGGIYALGKLDEFTQWVSAIGTVDMLRLLDISLNSAGLVKGDRIIETLRALTGEKCIEDLPISFTAVASDIVNEKEVWISRGPLFDAIRASIAIPLFFQPAEYNGMQLVDGAVLNPVPIAPTFRDHTDQTIAVNLSGKADPAWPKSASENKKDEPESFFTRKINQFIDSVRPTARSGDLEGMYDVAGQAIDTMEGAIARHKLAVYPPDAVIEIPRNLSAMLEFDRAQELIEAGYEIAGAQMAFQPQVRRMPSDLPDGPDNNTAEGEPP